MLKPGVIDLSHWNSIIGDSYSAALASLQRAKDSGIVGMVHKATVNITYTDDKLKARCDLCRDAGLLFGTYHFLRPGSMGNQVAFYYDQVMSVQKIADEADTWLWSCDYEDPNIPLSHVADFMEQLEAVIGKPPVLYTGFALKDKIAAGQDASRLTKYPLWLAHYASAPTLPKGWDEYWLWQYSDKASVPGIIAPTDVNAYDGSAEMLAFEWTGQQEQEEIDLIPEPPDGGDPALNKIVKIDLEVPPGIDVQLSVNGQIVYD
jgi:lysozyme